MRLFSSFALTRHTLAMDTRDFWIYFQRFFLACSTFLILYFVQRDITSGSSGLVFFQTYLILLLFIATFGAINIFSGAVSKEKEDGLIQLLILSNLKPFKFLLGRFTGKFMQLIYLLVLQLPFCIFGVTLGGVNISQILSAFFYLTLWLTLVSLISFYVSVLYSNRKESLIVSTFAVLIVYILAAIMLDTPDSRLFQILRTGVTSFVLFADEAIFVGIFFWVFTLCCLQFEERAIHPFSFLKKRQNKKRKIQIWMHTSPIVRIAMKNRFRIRFYPSKMLTQKDNYLYPPPPMHPFTLMFINNPGIAILALVSSSGLLMLLFFAHPLISITIVFLYLVYKTWSRLVLVFNYELEDNTFQSLAMLPISSKKLLTDKISNASMYAKQIIILYIIICSLTIFFTQLSINFKIAIVFMYVIKVISDYLTILAVFKVRHAPKASSAALIIFLSILYFMFPLFCIPIYTLCLMPYATKGIMP